MAIAFDAATGTTSTNTNTNTFTHTCSGTDRFLIVPCASLNNGALDAVTGVTYNGVAMTRLGSFYQVGTFNWIIYIYYLANPDSGTNNVVVTRNTSNGQTYGAAASYTGVDQITPIDNGVTSGTSTSPPTTTSHTSTTDNSWFFLTHANVDANSTASTGATLRGTASFICTRFDSGGPVTPAGSYSMTISWPGTRAGRSIMFAMRPAAGGGATFNNFKGFAGL